MKKWIYLVAMLALCISCRKENMGDCSMMKEAILYNEKAKAGAAVNAFINELDSKAYTEANMKKLVQAIQDCNINAELLGFDVIMTLPGQTEIKVSLTRSGVTRTRILDISYTTSNEMVFHNMHD